MTIAPPAVSYAVRILERQQCQRGGGCECRAAARRGHGKTHCILHDDPGPSLAVQERNGQLLVRCHAGCEQAVVIGALREAGLWPEQAQRVAGSGRSIVGKYDYRDAQGRLLYQTVRYKPKGFKQRRPDGPGAWIWKLDEPDAGLHTPRVLYRLPELQAADPAATVFVVEGEKDVDRLRALGLVATCNVGGASQWRHEYGEALRGRDVVVLPDNDDAGRKHVRQVADSLDGKSARVRIVALPGLPEHGDVSDWLESHSVDDLLAVCRSDELVPDTVWPEPEDRGDAVPSEQGAIEFVEDLLRPGRILVWGAEEGTGKSFATDGELAIRLAVAGGLFAGTWPVLRNGPVLVLSEMHSDDDYEREATVLRSLELDRSDLKGRYFRLSLMTAANGGPVLTESRWRSWILEWCKAHRIILLIFDTATAATQVDPWGAQIQAVFRDLRLMQAEYPDLAIVLVVHLRKPNGHAERRISDVMGEWARWSDVVVLQERDGPTRTKLSTFKRIRHERRIVATKRGGLLIDAKDISDGNGPKVPLEQVVSTIRAHPGLTIAELASRLQVGKVTAGRYVRAAIEAGHVRQETSSGRGTSVLFCEPGSETTASPHQTASQSGGAVSDAVRDSTTAPPHHHLYIGGAVSDAVSGTVVEACEECGRPLEQGEVAVCSGCYHPASLVEVTR